MLVPFYSTLGDIGFLIFNFIFILGLFFLLYKLISLSDYKNQGQWVALGTLLLVFGSSLTFYALHFHEYIIAWFLATVSLYFGLQSIIKDYTYRRVFFFGLFLGLAVVFRLEILIAFFPIAVYLSLKKRGIEWQGAFAILLGLALPLSIYFLGNLWVHGHPLSLRYVNNVSDGNAKTLTVKLYYIYRVLFEKEMGLLVQSPWVALVPIIGWIYRNEKLIWIASLWFTLSTFFILIALPNDGSHFAPRYLYGTFPLAIIVIVRPLLEISLWPVNYLKKTWIRSLGLFVLILLIGVSFSEYKKQMIRQLAFQKNILITNSSLQGVPEEKLLVFREYASPQNGQYILAHRDFVVADTKEKADYLVAKAKEKSGGVQFTIAFPAIALTQKSYTQQELFQLSEQLPMLNVHDFGIKPTQIDLRWPYIFLNYTVK
jgi:hypothetical protein